MLQITARVFDGDKLIGYQLYDGRTKQMFSRYDTWNYAKNKQIYNVKAVGSINDCGLSGTNGFELKSLPQIKWSNPSSMANKVGFTEQDRLAAFIRQALIQGKIQTFTGENNVQQYKDYTTQCLKQDVTAGLLSAQNCRILSSSIEIENLLYNSNDKKFSIVGDVRTSQEKEEGAKEIYAIMQIMVDCAYEVMDTQNKNEVTLKEILKATKHGKAQSYNNAVKLLGSESFKDAAKIFANLYAETIVDAIANKEMKIRELLTSNNTTITRDEIDGIGQIMQDTKRFVNIAVVDRKLKTAPRVAGYKVKNVGTQPITVLRVTSTPDHSSSPEELAPGSSIYINKIELAMLGSQPQVGCTFANGRLVAASSSKHDTNTNNNIYNWLNKCYFKFTDATKTRYHLDVQDAMIDVNKVLDKDTVAKYFSML